MATKPDFIKLYYVKNRYTFNYELYKLAPGYISEITQEDPMDDKLLKTIETAPGYVIATYVNPIKCPNYYKTYDSGEQKLLWYVPQNMYLACSDQKTCIEYLVSDTELHVSKLDFPRDLLDKMLELGLIEYRREYGFVINDNYVNNLFKTTKIDDN